MDTEMEAAVNAAVAEIERQMSPDDLLLEVRSHLISLTGDYATPVVEKKIKEFCEALLFETVPAIEAAVTPDEKWHLAVSARDACRSRIESLKSERLAEFLEIDKRRAPWRYRTQAKVPSSAMSVPENIIPSKVSKIEEVF
jgi:hypothetical protein